MRFNTHRFDVSRLLGAYECGPADKTSKIRHPMPRRSELRLSKRTIDALPAAGGDAVFWDRDLPGFGIRVHPSGRKVYLVQTRGPKGSKRVSLGRHGDLAPQQARKQAAEVIDRIKRGEEPLPAPPKAEPTVADLAERYLSAHVAVNCKPATAAGYRRTLSLHILPELGAMPIVSVERKHVADLHYKMRDTPTEANASAKILSRMYSLAASWGFETGGRNPCRFVRGYRERRRERFLTRDEYRRLGDALEEAEAKGRMSVYTVAAFRVLMLTGCRRNEVLELKWDDVGRTMGELRLRDTKTGPRWVPLTPEVTGILDALPRVDGNPWVFPGRGRDGRLVNINQQWGTLRSRAALKDVRIHDLRHSFASRALALGESLTTIGGLLGHTKVQTTARYAHLARDTEIASTARVGASIGAHIMPDGTDPEQARRPAEIGEEGRRWRS